ncbi:MAG TPA: NAD(P)-dependent oxidoreductase [Actinomycetota bacterium]|nr:NAD(P)-dependent oxidoreductase [Actinomycetota bacterium]
MTTVAFVGLGAMGSRMAARLLDAGHDLVAWNRTREKADALAERGAAIAETPADAAARAEVVITMVADPDALRAVTEGPEGVLLSAGDATTVIEMSTVGPAAVSRLRAALPEAAGLLDAPVLGSIDAAETGELEVFVGGSEELYDRWAPLLSALGSPIHVGRLGSGAAAKLVANSTLFGVLGALGEALALARGLGLSEDATFGILSNTPLGSQAERRRSAFESDDYPLRFSLSLARKDVDLMLAAAADGGVELRLAAAARSWLAEAEASGWADRDYASVLSWIARRPT